MARVRMALDEIKARAASRTADADAALRRRMEEPPRPLYAAI